MDGKVRTFYSIDNLSNEEFVILSKKYNELETLADKIAFIYSKSSTSLMGLLNPVQRKIKRKEYSYGLTINDSHTANKIANTCIDVLKYELFEDKIREVNNRVADCSNIVEKVDLLNEEIRFIQTGHNRDQQSQKLYLQGYRSEVAKKPPFEYPTTSWWIDRLPNEKLNTGIILLLSDGAACRLLELLCYKKLQQIRGKKPLYFETKSDQNNDTNGLQVNNGLSGISIDKNGSLELDIFAFFQVHDANKKQLLVNEYRDKKPKDYAYFLVAAKNLGLIAESEFENITELHRNIKKVFGSVGSRQILYRHLKNLDSQSPYYNSKINQHIAIIKKICD